MDEKIVNRTHKVRTRWCDYRAQYLYIVKELVEYDNGEIRHMNTYEGDREWAERMAAHYKFELPKEEA